MGLFGKSETEKHEERIEAARDLGYDVNAFIRTLQDKEPEEIQELLNNVLKVQEYINILQTPITQTNVDSFKLLSVELDSQNKFKVTKQ